MPETAGAIRAGRAYVEMFLHDSPLVRGMKGAEAKMLAFGKTIQAVGLKMMGLGAAMVTPLVGAGKAFANMGDTIAKMSGRTGIIVESLSVLAFAAGQSGTSLEEVEVALKKMQSTVYDAAQGTGEAKKAMDALGLSVEQFQGLNTEQQFRLFADALANVRDATARAALAQDLFGRSGTALLPLLSAGAAGLDKFAAEAKSLGLIFTEQDAKSAVELKDAFGRLTYSIKIAVARVGAELAPKLRELAGRMTEVVAQVGRWVKMNGDLIRALLTTGLKVAAVGAALALLGTAIRKVTVAAAFLIAHPLAMLAAGLAAVTVAMYGLRAAMYRTSDAAKRLGEENDRQRAVDLGRLSRLQELSEAERLSASEMKEAKDHVAELGSRYGDLGIRLDEVTGKLGGVGDAQARVNALMRQAVLADLDAQWHEVQQNMDKVLDQLGSTEMRTWIDDVLGRETADELKKQADLLSKQSKAILARMKALKAGEAGALTGEAGMPTAAGIPLPAAPAVETAVDKEISAYQRVRQLQIGMIEDRYERERALIDERYDAEIGLAWQRKALDAEVTALEEARRLELAQVDIDKAKELADVKEQAAIEYARQQDVVADLVLQANYKGLRLEQERLKLAKARALENAKGNPEMMALIQEEYWLREQLLKSIPLKGIEAAATGTFSAAVAARLGAMGPAERTATATEQTAKNTRRIQEQLEEGGLEFGA